MLHGDSSASLQNGNTQSDVWLDLLTGYLERGRVLYRAVFVLDTVVI